MLVLALAIIALAKRNRGLAGALVLLGATADLAVANSRCVTVVPQSLFDGEPEVLHRIREAEEQNPAPGPYRIYRMPLWNPPDWLMETADERGRQFVEWERATLQPKYGINDGVEHTHTIGVAEIYEYEWFFGGFPRNLPDRYFSEAPEADWRSLTRVLAVFENTTAVAYWAWFN